MQSSSIILFKSMMYDGNLLDMMPWE